MQARSRAAAASVAVSYRHTSRHRTEHATGGLLKKWGPALGVGKKKFVAFQRGLRRTDSPAQPRRRRRIEQRAAPARPLLSPGSLQDTPRGGQRDAQERAPRGGAAYKQSAPGGNQKEDLSGLATPRLCCDLWPPAGGGAVNGGGGVYKKLHVISYKLQVTSNL